MKSQGGFTLVEVLMAGVLTSLLLLGVASMALTAYRQLDRSSEHTSAVALSQQRVEWLRNQDYTALAAGSTTELLSGPYDGYTRTTTIQSGIPRAGVKQITVVTSTPAGMAAQVVALVAER